MEGRRVFIAVPILVLWYSFHAVVSRFAGTCTMGDTDRFVAGLILGVPAAAIAVALLLVSEPRARWQIGVLLASSPFALLALYLWIPLAISAGIRGHHLCGPEFDDHLVGTTGWERLIPLAHVGIAAALLVGGFRRVRRGWSTAQPGVEPNGRLRGRGLAP